MFKYHVLHANSSNRICLISAKHRYMEYMIYEGIQETALAVWVLHTIIKPAAQNCSSTACSVLLRHPVYISNKCL